MHRDHRRHRAARAHRVELGDDRRVVGGVERARARLARGSIEAAIGGDRRAVGDLRREIRIVRAPVAVGDQTRVARQHQRRGERGGEPARDVRGADVPGDVAVELGDGEAEIAERTRHQPAGVVADHEHVAVGGAGDALDRRRIVGA
jgi:hypothetical protein